MRSHLSIIVSVILGISVLLALSLVFRWGGEQGLASVEQDVLNASILLGSLFALLMVRLRPRPTENMQPWHTGERLAWTLIATGSIVKGIGGFLRQYLQTTGQEPSFSWTSLSPAALCFLSAPPLVLLGLFFLSSSATRVRRALVLLDSLISTGSLFAIGWFLLLGSLTLAPGKDLVSRLLNVYDPTIDVLTVSYILYLLLSTFVFNDYSDGTTLNKQRSISTVHRISLLVLSLGLIVFVSVDFRINVQLSMGIYQGNASWTDLGWSLGAMTIGVAAYLRRFLPATMDSEHPLHGQQLTFHLHLQALRFLPYLLVLFPMLVLIFNVLSSEQSQRQIRPVLTIVTLFVVGVVLIRQIVTMIENERLIKDQALTVELLKKASQEIVQNMALRAEINVAAKIQMQLLPRTMPQVEGLDLFAQSNPAKQVGGDFYDMFFRQGRPFVFALGDISGKGLPAALLMTMTRTVLHTATRSLSLIDPHAILIHTNEDLYDDFTEVGMLATVFVGSYDPRSAQLSYANAGHSPVIYCPKGGPARLLEADTTVLGVLPTISCNDHILHFHTDDVLMVGTDGLNESFNVEGEMFGYNRLLNVVEMLAHLPASQLGAELLTTIHQFTQGRPQSDDQTLIVLKGVATSMLAGGAAVERPSSL